MSCCAATAQQLCKSERDSGSHSQLFSCSDADNNSSVTKAIFVDDKYYSKGNLSDVIFTSKCPLTVLQTLKAIRNICY